MACYIWIVLLLLIVISCSLFVKFSQTGGASINDIPFGEIQTRNQNLEDTII